MLSELALSGEGLNGETLHHREANVRLKRELLGAFLDLLRWRSNVTSERHKHTLICQHTQTHKYQER